MSSLSNKLSNLKNKSVVLEVKDIKYPENISDPLVLFEKNSSARTASANDWTIDVFPSQIPIMMYIMQIASSASAAADHKQQAKSSLATFVLYYTVVLQGFFLLNDLHVRPAPSSHAASWSSVSWKNDFATYLLSLPVPDSMKTIFAQLSATETERTKNVFFVPSAAGFNLRHFFGRFVPVNFFASLHDCIATMPGNSAPKDIQNDFLARQLFKTLASSLYTGKTFVTCADILGIHTDGTSATYATGKWYQVFSSVFNPVLFRDFHRRSSLATLDLQAPNFKHAKSINAYDILFSATPYNLQELRTLLDHLTPIIRSVVPMSKSLSSVISESSGINILQHGYSTYALPTWLANPDNSNKTFLSGTGKLKSEDADTRATFLTFLKASPSRPATTREIKVGTGFSTAHPLTGLTFPWSLFTQANDTSPWPQDDHFVKFDEIVHVTPKVLVLDVSASESVSAHLATLCGMIIETFEIDGTSIEHPNVDKSLAAQNSLFADSAIPFKYVVYATRFHTRTDELPPVIRRHLQKPSTSQSSVSFLHDRIKFMLPRINASASKLMGVTDIYDPATTTTIPGTSDTGPFDWIKYAQSFLGFRTLNPNSGDDDDNVPSMELGRLYVWSPYTYTPMFDSDCSELIPDLSENRSYFLTNLRSIFGTDTNMVEVVHPFVAMPV